jgi:hypothetical protein
VAAAGGLTVSEDALALAAGVVVSAAVGMTESEDGLAVAAAAVFVAETLRGRADCPVGWAASAAGVLAVSEDGLLVVAAGAVAAAAGGMAVSEDGLLVVAAGAVAAAAGGMTVSEDGLAVATGATAAAAQWSEIMFSSVTAKLLSAAPELAAPLALCPMRFTSWPRCGLRSTLLLVILKSDEYHLRQLCSCHQIRPSNL